MQILHQVQPLPPKAHTALLLADGKCWLNTKGWTAFQSLSCGWCLLRATDPTSASPPLIQQQQDEQTGSSRAPVLLPFMLWDFTHSKSICFDAKRIAKLADCYMIPLPMRHERHKCLLVSGSLLCCTLQGAEWGGVQNLRHHGKLWNCILCIWKYWDQT